MIGRRLTVALGIAGTLGATALWYGPLGTADQFTGEVEQTARRTLDHYEMTPVQARLEREPLSRRMILSGPADDFQRSELVRIMGEIPGVGEARWVEAPDRRTIPLIVEAMLYALAGFALGLLLAYLVELRRRANAQWRW